MSNFKCKECDLEYESLDSLRRHRSQKHKINAEQTYVDYVLNGIKPKCKCGCGEKPKYLGIESGFRDYIRGHASRVNNNWGHNPRAIKKSHDTQRKMHANGSLKVWNDGLTINDPRVKDNVDKVMSNPNRGKKISKALSNIPKTKNHKEKISKSSKIRWSDPEEREKQSERTITRLLKNNYRNPKTKLESTFEDMLKTLNIDYFYQYKVRTAIFDFIVNDEILIEVDGDFHHCNPNTKHRIPIHSIQIKTVGNDIKKNLIAEDSGYKLLRFWESDIKNNPDGVIERLKQELGI